VKNADLQFVSHEGEGGGGRLLLESKAAEIFVAFELEATENLRWVDSEGGKGILEERGQVGSGCGVETTI